MKDLKKERKNLENYQQDLDMFHLQSLYLNEK